MKIALYGRNLEELPQLLKPYSVEIVKENPDLVICHGGDGTLLGAENFYPGITKCPIRDSVHNPKCSEHSTEFILEKLFSQQLSTTVAERLEAIIENQSETTPIVALNDICINKRNIASAMRFRLWINDALETSQAIGDGLIVSTIFGSTGYFRSITKSTFRVGMGIAFNNLTEPLDHLVIPSDAVITVEILRGPAVLLGDNHPQRLPLDIGSRIRIQRSPISTPILGLETFRCHNCFLRRSDGTHLYLASNPSEY